MLRRLARALGHQPWFARIGRGLVPADRFIGRITKGRVVALGLFPSMIITTTGRKSGQPRTQPLVFIPDGDGFVIIGSNWGQPGHPSWSTNLLANPEAEIKVNGQTVAVRAKPATGAERDRLWALATSTWPAYDTYQSRAGSRKIRVFRLERR